MTVTTINPTTTTTDYGSLLGPEVWAALAAEYLDGAHEADDLAGHRLDADGAARRLGRYVRAQVDRDERGQVRDAYLYGLNDPVRFMRFDTAWTPVAGQPYDGLEDLSLAVVSGSANVSTDYCDHPVWDLDTNLRFRIWHDTAHVEHRLGFGADDELRLFGVQAHEVAGAGQAVVDALFCESVYQLAAFVHLGSYPDVQYVRTLGPVGRAVRDLLLGLTY
jgi:hypothetical protein